MKIAAFPENEAARLLTLRTLNLLDTPMEERFDRIVRILCNALDVPMGAISLVDDIRQWFKACQGLCATETSRDTAFCAHAILEQDVMIVPDATKDPRFSGNPLVTGETNVRFYAGQPITVRGMFSIGTLCAIDTKPRVLTEGQKSIMRDLAKIAEAEISAISLSQTHFDLVRKKS